MPLEQLREHRIRRPAPNDFTYIGQDLCAQLRGFDICGVNSVRGVDQFERCCKVTSFPVFACLVNQRLAFVFKLLSFARKPVRLISQRITRIWTFGNGHFGRSSTARVQLYRGDGPASGGVGTH